MATTTMALATTATSTTTTNMMEFFQEIFQCGSATAVVEEIDEGCDLDLSTSSLVHTSSAASSIFRTSAATYDDNDDEEKYPSGEKLKGMVLPMLPRHKETASFSSVTSIRSLLCGDDIATMDSINDRCRRMESRDDAPWAREEEQGANNGSSNSHKKKKSNKDSSSSSSYRYVLRLSPDVNKYTQQQQQQAFQDRPNLALRRTQSDSFASLPDISLSSSSFSSSATPKE